MIKLNIIEIVFIYVMCNYIDIKKVINMEFEIHVFLIIMILLMGYIIRKNLRILLRDRIRRY